MGYAVLSRPWMPTPAGGWRRVELLGVEAPSLRDAHHGLFRDELRGGGLIEAGESGLALRLSDFTLLLELAVSPT